MAEIALFHSALGADAGVGAAAQRLAGSGHQVLVADQYEGRTFVDYDEAGAFAGQIGWPVLMGRALAAVRQLPDGFLCIGFSNGAGMAEYVATQRAVGGVVLCSGAVPLPMLGAEAWPTGVPVQLHQSADDPFRQPGWSEAVADAVRAAGAPLDLFEYSGSGHLFTDPTRSGEYDPVSADLFWERVEAFCAAPPRPASTP